MTSDRWIVRGVSERTRNLVKLHATLRKLTAGDMVDLIVDEWHRQHPLSSYETDDPIPGDAGESNDS